jgi:hypothetical protein
MELKKKSKLLSLKITDRVHLLETSNVFNRCLEKPFHQKIRNQVRFIVPDRINK